MGVPHLPNPTPAALLPGVKVEKKASHPFPLHFLASCAKHTVLSLMAGELTWCAPGFWLEVEWLKASSVER